MKIPCEECIVLAICRQKTDFKCDILYDFMNKNIEYENGKVVNGSQSYKIWCEINKYFQRADTEISFYGETHFGPKYCVLSLDEEKKRL